MRSKGAGKTENSDNVGETTSVKLTENITPKHTFIINFLIKNHEEWAADNTFLNTWYTNGLKSEHETGAAVYYTDTENINERYQRNERINIFEDSPPALTIFTNLNVWEWREEMNLLVGRNIHALYKLRGKQVLIGV